MTLRRGGLWKVRDVVFVGAPELVSEVLRDGRRFGKGGKLLGEIARYIGPTSLFTTDDDEIWRLVHDPVVPYFSRTALPAMVDLAASVWARTMQGWSPGLRVPTYSAHSTFSVEFLMRYGFGDRFAEDEIQLITDSAFAVFEEMSRCLPVSLVSPTLAARLDRGARQRFEMIVHQIIDRIRGDPGADLVSALLDAQATEPRITDQVIRDQVFGLLVAGFDSMSAVFSLAIRELATDPTRFGLLKREVTDLVGSDHRPPTFDELQLLPATRTFVAEMTALHPAFPLFPLSASQDTTLGGVPIDTGTTVVVNLDAQAAILAARRAEHRTDPGRSAYLSYGAGKRQCLAMHMSQTLLELTTAMLVQRCAGLALPLRSRAAPRSYAMTLSAPAKGSVLIR